MHVFILPDRCGGFARASVINDLMKAGVLVVIVRVTADIKVESIKDIAYVLQFVIWHGYPLFSSVLFSLTNQ